MNILDIKKYFFSFCGASLIFILTIIFKQILQIFELIEPLSQNNIIVSIILIVGYFVSILMVWKAYNEDIVGDMYKKISIKSFFDYNKQYILLVLLLLIFSKLFVELSNYVIITFFPKIPDINNSDVKYSAVFFISYCIYAPFVEELVYRGMFFNIAYSYLDMNNKVVKYIAIIINIIGFLLIHYVNYGFQNYNIILSVLMCSMPRLLISISLTYVYIKTKDIKYNIILHMLYNSLGIMVFMLFINI